MINPHYDPHRHSARRNTVVFALFACLLAVTGWYSLTTTLTEMTERDCRMGVKKACDALR